MGWAEVLQWVVSAAHGLRLLLWLGLELVVWHEREELWGLILCLL